MFRAERCQSTCSMLFHPYVTGSAKTSHVHTQPEACFIAPSYKTMLNNNAYLLPPLANVTGLLFQSAFYQPYKFTTGEMMPMADSKSAMESCYCSHC